MTFFFFLLSTQAAQAQVVKKEAREILAVLV